MSRSSNTARVAIIGAIVLAVAGGGTVAGSTAPPSSGGEPVVLRLATIDAVNGNGQAYGPEAFVNNLEAVSGGQLKVEVLTDYGNGDVGAESQIVEDIAAGVVDGGWPTVRAFANAGIPGLQAVEAPMTISSYDAEKELVSGPVADTVLSQLEGTGVLGLDLAVGPLRRPFAAVAPLLSPEDWQGARFRAYNSPVQAATITALGAEPVNIGIGPGGWLDEVLAGHLRGAEIDIPQYYENGLTTEAGNVASNVVLWPKVYVLSLSQDTFDGLTAEQQGWVRQAADQAMQTSVDATYDETTLARRLCDGGARFIPASPDQLDALHAAVQPVIDGLAADPDTADVLTGIQAIAADYPDTDIPDVPASCQTGTATAAPTDSSATPTIPDETSVAETASAASASPAHLVMTLEGHTAGVGNLAFSPDGTRLFSSGDDGTIRVWDTTTGDPVGDPIRANWDAVLGMALSPDGMLLATTGHDATLRLWDAATGEPVGEPMTAPSTELAGVAFSPDGTVVATASGDSTVRLWDPATSEPVGEALRTDARPTGVAFSPDGTLLASAGEGGSIQLWDPVTGDRVGEPLAGHAEWTFWLSFSPDGTQLASSGGDGTVRFWDVATGDQLGEPLRGHTTGVIGMVFNPDWTVVATCADNDGTVRVWDPSTRQQIGEPLTTNAGHVCGVAFSPDGTLLASGGADGTVQLWQLDLS